MRCPHCAAADTRVIDSRPEEGGETVRRRQCTECNARFTTREQAVLQLPAVIKENGAREPFAEDKLRRGMARALEKRPIDAAAVEAAVRRIMHRFMSQGEREIPAQAIGEAVMQELGELDEVAYVRFASVYRRFRDVAAFGDEVANLRARRRGKVRRSLFGVRARL